MEKIDLKANFRWSRKDREFCLGFLRGDEKRLEQVV